MVDIASITAAVTGLKTAADIAKSMIGLKTESEIRAKVIELQSVILAAQSSALAANSDQFALLERARELEGELASVKAWESEKQRYKLRDFGGGTFAYVLDPERSEGEPPHRLCAACFHKEEKSILQFQYESGTSQDKYLCTACKAEYFFGVRQDDRPTRAYGGDDWMT